MMTYELDEVERRVLEGVKDVGQAVSIATLRAAIYDVIDGGCTCESGEKHPWELDDDPNDPEVTEEIVNAQRERFVDAVAARITELQAAPHLYDEKLLTRLNDAKAEYRRGYRDGWDDAMAGASGAGGEDLIEMQRLIKERLDGQEGRDQDFYVKLNNILFRRS